PRLDSPQPTGASAVNRTRPFTAALLAALGASLLLVAAEAQSVPVQRVFPRSKSDVEKALRTLQAFSGGRLPILDGFVTSDQPLDRYQRPYYQYSVQVISKDAGSPQMQVSARITAWYA